MSSSRPSDTGRVDDTDLPDPADLPEDDGSGPADLFPEGVGFSNESDDSDDPTTYAVGPGQESSRGSGSAGSQTSSTGERDETGETGEAGGSVSEHSLRERWAAARERVRPWSAWTLRAKLVASMLALFTVLSMMTAVFSVTALNQSLIGQVDQQLSDSLNRPSRGGPDDGGDGGAGGGPGADRMEVFLTTNGNAGYVYRAGARTSLSANQIAIVKAAGLGSVPKTLDLGGDTGRYRMVAATRQIRNLQTGDQITGTYVAGISTGPTDVIVGRMIVIAIATVGAGIILVALVGTWLVRRNLEPLRRVAATATKVSQTPLASGRVALAERVDPADTDTRTEVGQVGAAFNEMLDHVDEALNSRHQSEQRVRQFVADASHELRTPLASIKGYAELSRREPEVVPQTVTHAMGRIESEANRMSSLVEDLLLLARLDAGRPLEEAPVDMSMLVINAVSDAHAASPGHRWDLDLPPEPVEVTGDGARLHQVVANLLANARTHTPDGTRVTTSVRPEGRWVRVAVHDNGPGVPESLQPNVFERFARGDDARVRAGGSTGLGLSIVAAVSKAHGGRVELDSRPGDTTFSLLLPAAP
ncbi:HAMP domain-containing sensor histidine kinase [Terrabacter carboxydivorans]|uniref:histidine kinase n=1 Tax=Terrabacter carboxydivorans TaxID=619730 RepID=A0ABN3LCD2_9MICO